jgi:hypothetical protein
LYMAMGRIPDELEESRKALEIDPLDLYLNGSLGHLTPNEFVAQRQAILTVEDDTFSS